MYYFVSFVSLWPRFLCLTTRPGLGSSVTVVCEVSVVLSHFGLGSCVSLLDPASAVLSRWPRLFCLTRSTSLIDVFAIFALSGFQSGRGGRRVGGVIDG